MLFGWLFNSFLEDIANGDTEIVDTIGETVGETASALGEIASDGFDAIVDALGW